MWVNILVVTFESPWITIWRCLSGVRKLKFRIVFFVSLTKQMRLVISIKVLCLKCSSIDMPREILYSPKVLHEMLYFLELSFINFCVTCYYFWSTEFSEKVLKSVNFVLNWDSYSNPTLCIVVKMCTKEGLHKWVNGQILTILLVSLSKNTLLP